MRRLLMVLIACAAVAGCSPRALNQPRQGQITSADLHAVLQPDGTVTVSMHVEFVSERGGVVPVPKPLLGDVRDVVVNGTPATAAVDFETMNIPVTGSSADATFTLAGITDAYADGVTVEMPIFAEPSDGSRQDPPVDLTGDLAIPESAASEVFAQWDNGLQRRVDVSSTTIAFRGKAPMWLGSELAVVLPAGTVQTDPPVFGSAAAFRTQQDLRETQNLQLEKTLDEQDMMKRVADGVVVGVSLVVAFVCVGGVVRANRAGARERAAAVEAAPDYVREPPDDLDPALVAVLVGEARGLDRDAVAGTVLDLVARGALRIEAVGDRFTIDVADAPPRTDGEHAIVSAVRAMGAGVSGPPLFPRADPALWRAYRRDAFRRAKTGVLIERRFRFLYLGPLAAAIPALVWPFVDSRFLAVVPWAVIAGCFVLAIPLGGGYRLTHQAYTSLARWLAFARYVRDHAELRDLSPAAVTVWGPYLAYAAVLGAAPRAARELAPRGGRERAARGDIDEAVSP